MMLWYDRPANGYGVKSPRESWRQERPDLKPKPNPDEAWYRYALPLGNGSLGAMVYGNVEAERVQLNGCSVFAVGCSNSAVCRASCASNGAFYNTGFPSEALTAKG